MVPSFSKPTADYKRMRLRQAKRKKGERLETRVSMFRIK